MAPQSNTGPLHSSEPRKTAVELQSHGRVSVGWASLALPTADYSQLQFMSFLNSHGVMVTSLAPDTGPVLPAAWAALSMAACLQWCPRGWLAGLGRTYVRLPSPAQVCVITGSLLIFAAVGGSGTPFIYYQF